jgi:Xaa-Pro aminopeptidase
MVECSGPGGYFTESGRIFVIGQEPLDVLKEAFGLSVEVQHYIGNLLKPGITTEEIRTKLNEKLKSLGQPPETRIGLHGQGYHIQERPSFVPGELFVVQAGMNIAVHPSILLPGAFGFAVDNYLITEKGGELLMKNPQEVIRV